MISFRSQVGILYPLAEPLLETKSPSPIPSHHTFASTESSQLRELPQKVTRALITARVVVQVLLMV